MVLNGCVFLEDLGLNFVCSGFQDFEDIIISWVTMEDGSFTLLFFQQNKKKITNSFASM